MNKNLCVLLILDGFGISKDLFGNSIAKAKTDNIDRINAIYPNIGLHASGMNVGLPDGQMGNSEVGHLNIGTGRIIYQELTRITKSINDGDFFKNEKLIKVMDNCIKNDTNLHVMGLASDGGVHAHYDHLKAVLKLAKEKNVKKTYIHLFTDGRDVSPTSGHMYIKNIKDYINQISYGIISTISGRYYTMDRDKRWDRVQKAYDAIVRGIGEDRIHKDPVDVLKSYYNDGITDEFVPPTLIEPNGNIKDKDSCIFVNFRPDRARELTYAIVDKGFKEFDVENLDINFLCMTMYDKKLNNVLVAFEPEVYPNTLGEYLSNQNKKQLRIAETEKYAHVTFFFNGGIEQSYNGEDRILIPSPNVKTYDLKPEMSLPELTDTLIQSIESDKYDFIVCNIANPDMVGHTGNFEATIKAIESVDLAVGKISDKILSLGHKLFITADHGNAECMVDENGGPMTAHTCNKVPFIYVSGDYESIEIKESGKLADIAPTILNVMGLDVPPEITGENLITKNN